MSRRLDLAIAILKTGKTKRSLSLDLRIAETRFSAIINGRTHPTADEVLRIEKLLGDNVFGDEERGELVEQRSRRQ